MSFPRVWGFFHFTGAGRGRSKRENLCRRFLSNVENQKLSYIYIKRVKNRFSIEFLVITILKFPRKFQTNFYFSAKSEIFDARFIILFNTLSTYHLN